MSVNRSLSHFPSFFTIICEYKYLSILLDSQFFLHHHQLQNLGIKYPSFIRNPHPSSSTTNISSKASLGQLLTYQISHSWTALGQFKYPFQVSYFIFPQAKSLITGYKTSSLVVDPPPFFQAHQSTTSKAPIPEYKSSSFALHPSSSFHINHQ